MNNNLTSLASLNFAIIATDYTELSIVTLLNIQETYSSAIKFLSIIINTDSNFETRKVL